MTSRSNTLSVIALIVGLASLSLGGYLILTNIFFPTEENNPVARVYYEGPAYTISSGTTGTLDFNKKSYDSHNAFNLSANTYTIPLTGFYQVSTQYGVEGQDADLFRIYLYQNDDIASMGTTTSSLTLNPCIVSVTDIINATAGDVIKIRYYSFTGGSRDVFPTEYATFFSIALIA